MRKGVAPAGFGVGEGQLRLAGDQGAEEAGALGVVSRRGDEAAAEQHARRVGFDDEAAAEPLHERHERHRVAAEPAIGLGERNAEPAEFGEGGPLFGGEAGFALRQRAAGLEVVFVADEALDAFGEQRLFLGV